MFEKTELALMPTFRCNAKCQMCHIWKSPTRPEEEITLDDINRLPSGFARINIGGGEPTLRSDIYDIVDALSKKTKHIEISTNGYLTDRLVAIAGKYPNIRIRVSLEGLPNKNDEIRGLKNGFDHGLRSILKLKSMGIKDIGFAMTISHRNADEIVDLYHLAAYMGVEFSQSMVHDAWQFRIPGNIIENKEYVLNKIKDFIKQLLLSKRHGWFLRIKDWFRAYVNRGFINFVRGDKRILPCGAGTDIIFIDPYGDVYPCNALCHAIGNIKRRSFEKIWTSEEARKVRLEVAECEKNCWMMGTVRPVIKKNLLKPMAWIIKNKLKLLLGKDICIDD